MSGTGPRFRTPADVRAIPNEQWDAWFIACDFPWGDFSPERTVQIAFKHVRRAQARRVMAALR